MRKIGRWDDDNGIAHNDMRDDDMAPDDIICPDEVNST